MRAEEAAPLSRDDLEILQELLNMAFGAASAELAARLDQGVELRVPDVQVIPGVLLRYYVGAELRREQTLSVVEQRFAGDLHGTAFLVLPAEASRRILPLLGPAPAGAPATLLHEALVEASRILVGTCLQQLAQLLEARVMCGPPTVTVEAERANAVRPDLFSAGNPAVVLRTAFDFGQDDVHGYLFLASSDAFIQWLKPALHRFMGRYA